MTEFSVCPLATITVVFYASLCEDVPIAIQSSKGMSCSQQCTGAVTLGGAGDGVLICVIQICLQLMSDLMNCIK